MVGTLYNENIIHKFAVTMDKKIYKQCKDVDNIETLWKNIDLSINQETQEHIGLKRTHKSKIGIIKNVTIY